jgi:hypothetical protein
MKIHPQITHLNGIVSVVFTAQFVGDPTDASDRDHITAYGDPLVNLGGSFSDGATPTPFTFSTGSPEVWTHLTTEMQGKVVRFMSQIPPAQNGQSALAGPLDVVTSDPVTAATLYVTAIQARIATVMGQLRLKSPAKLSSLPDSIV